MQETNCHYVSKNIEYTRLSMHHFEKLFINVFYAPKHPQSENFLTSLQSISSFFSEALIIFIDIEKCPDLVKNFQVLVIPTVILSDANKKQIKRLENIQANELILSLEDDLILFKSNFSIEKQRMFEKIDTILGINPIMIFIKGTPQEPKCGFTSSLLEIVKGFSLNFGYFNILEDEDIRNWLRYYSKWNTYPQFYINKKIIGGLDVIKDLIAKSKFEELLPINCRKNNPEMKIQRILEECMSKIVVFLKDLASDDSKTMMKLLKDNGVKFVISEVRNDEILEKFLLESFKEKNLPLCFIKGEFIGNIQKTRDFCEKKNILKMISQNEWSLSPKQKFEFLLNNFNLICFIEGDFEDTKYVENKKLFDILNKNQIEFQYFNVLFDKEVRDIVVEFTGFKMFPQIIQNKKLVGGTKLIEKIETDGDIKNLFK